ncbi:hypothetical protein ACET3Z_002054 [Daucus carota]
MATMLSILVLCICSPLLEVVHFQPTNLQLVGCQYSLMYQYLTEAQKNLSGAFLALSLGLLAPLSRVCSEDKGTSLTGCLRGALLVIIKEYVSRCFWCYTGDWIREFLNSLFKRV